MSTIGVAPPDFTDIVGQFRLLVGDTNATIISGGQGTYLFFSDEEINGYILLQSNIYRAAGMALNALATQAADQAQMVKDYDLQVDMRQRAEQFREQAKAMFEQAHIVDAEGGEGFQIVSTGRRYTRAELAELDLTLVDYTEFIV
jgi:hypothetical protein